MTRFALGLLFLVSLGCNSITAAADVSGLWTIKQERDFRGNAVAPYECTLKQRGRELTVKCGTDPKAVPMKGEAHGRKMTWGLEKTTIPPMPADRIVLTYTAEVNESGTHATGMWRLTSSVLDEKGKFEAHKKQ